jgi:hypothetical protein
LPSLLSASSPNRHASIRTLCGAIAPVPVGVLNSTQRALPSRNRTAQLLLSEECVLCRRRSHPNSTICNEPSLITPLAFSVSAACSRFAGVRRLLPLPIAGAARCLIFVPLQSPLLSLPAFRRVQQASVPNVSGPYPVLGGPGCNGLLAPASCADRHRPLW